MGKTSSVHSKSDEQQEEVGSKEYRWLFHSTGKILLVTACLTISYIGFLLADALVLFVIGYLLKDLVEKYSYVQTGFEGLRIFSALITGVVYLCHLLYAVYDQVHFIVGVVRQQRDGGKEER